jgi:hypothetical protein
MNLERVRFLRWAARVAALFAAVGGLLTTGCGAPNGNVTGRVTHKGKPLTSGTVTFLTAGNKVFTSQIASDGSYTVLKLPAGPVQIGVQIPPAFTYDDPQMPSASPAAAATQPITIPPKYHDPSTSGLTLDVTGANQTHNIELP